MVILVVDSNDRERVDEAKEEMWRMLAEDELKSCIFLVMANKQDLPHAMSVQEVTEKLELEKIRNREWRKSCYFWYKTRTVIDFLCRCAGDLCHYW